MSREISIAEIESVAGGRPAFGFEPLPPVYLDPTKPGFGGGCIGIDPVEPIRPPYEFITPIDPPIA